MISIHLSSKKLEGRYPVDLSKDKVRDLPSHRERLHVFDKHRVSQSTLHSHHPHANPAPRIMFGDTCQPIPKSDHVRYSYMVGYTWL